MKRDALDWDLLDRYFARELDEAWAAIARRSLIGHEREALVLQVFQKELDGGASIGPVSGEDARASWSRIQTQIPEHVVSWKRPASWFWHSQRRQRLALGGLGLSVLAVAAILAAGSRTYGNPATESHFARRGTTYTTPEGQQSKVILPDGSTVLLNVASRLEVPIDFAHGNRRVTLSGAALFSVQPDTKLPFLVTVGKTEVRVLGTTFVVRAYDTDTTTTVAVRDGRVVVGPVVVSAAQQVIMTRTGAALLDVTSPAPFAFEKGVLMLDGVLLQDAVADLNRWYNVDLRIADPVLARSVIRATLPAGSVADLMTMLEFLFDAVVVRENQVLTLYGR